ncbi:MAG: chorismate mutase [Parachlamydiales bacterium]|jgi:chorismate mutase
MPRCRKKNSSGLKNGRRKIDLIDQQLIYLLNQRKKIALQLLFYKKKLRDPKREKQILQKAGSPYLKTIFQEILKSTKKAQRLKRAKKLKKL